MGLLELPTRQDCYYIIEMVDAGLIDASHWQPWAGRFVELLDETPMWLIYLALKRSQEEVLEVLRGYVYSDPCEQEPPDLENFHLGCLWLRHEIGGVSWARYLALGGDLLDCRDRIPACETHFHYLRIHQEASFSPESEVQTKRDYFEEQNLKPWIQLAREKFEPFRVLHRADKALD